MRRHKFRAWDRNNKRILQGFESAYMDIWDGCVYELNGGFDDIDATMDYLHLDIMEFTGFKDKKNIEIYEGDIVKLYDIRYTKPLIGKVCFNTELGRWIIYPTIGQKRDLTAEKASKCEIIGNIYENKELLK